MANSKDSSPNDLVHILHVDDDLPILETSKQILMMENNFEIDSATSVDEAKKKLAVKNYDVIISDYEMPLKNGLDFLKELREQENKIPFILFTGKGREEVAIRALNLGADGYHNKQGTPETIFGELSHSIHLVVDRNKAKHALEESEKRYHALMEQATASIIVHDSKGKIIDANQQACKNLGYTKDELIQISIDDIDKESIETGKDAFWPNVITGQKFIFESKQKRKDGSTFPVEVSLGPIIIDKDTVIMALIKDITERKKTEEILTEKEAKYEELANSVPQLVFETDIEGNITFTNKKAPNITGFTLNERPNVFKFSQIVSTSEQDKIKEVVKRVMNGENVDAVEFNLLRKDGSTIPAMVWISPRRERGKIVGLRGLAVDISERKRNEEALMQSEERWKFALEGAGDGVWDWNAQTNKVHFSTQWKRMLGYEENEISNSFNEWDKRIHPADREQTYQEINKLLSGQSSLYISEHRLRCKDGSYKWILDRGKIISRTADGKPLRVVGTHTDITEQKNIEEELKISSNLFNLATDSILAHDMDGNIVYFNEATCKQTGYTKEEMSKMNLRDLDAPESAQFIESRFKELLKEGSAVFESEQIRKDRTRVSVEVHAKLVDSNGKKLILSVVRDITERKKAQDALIESQSQLKLLADNMHDVVWIMTKNGRFIYISPSVMQLRGYTPQEVKQQSLEQVLTLNSQLKVNEVLKTLMKTGDIPAKYLELEQTCKNGSTVWTEINFTIIYDTNGKPQQILGVGRDITERKKMEEELKASEERYRTLFDQAGDYILILEIPRGEIPIIYDANDYALKVHGYTKEEIVGKPITFLDVSSSESTFRERIKHLLKDEKITFEAEHKRKDGSRFTAEIVNKHIKVGGKDFLLAIERDITERKKVEEELKIYYNFLSLANDSILVVDLDGSLVYFNEAAYKKLGYSKEEIAKMNLRDLDTPESAQLLESRINDLLKKGSLVFESVQLRKDRSRIPIEVHARVIDSNGKKLILGVLRDITERKKAEDKLRQSDRIFEYSMDMICIAGFDGHFKVLNPAWSKTLGWSNEELLSKPWIEFVHPKDRDATVNVRASLVNGQEVFQFRNRYICKDGSIKWLAWNSFPYPAEKIIFGIARDITEQKEAEDKLAIVNEKLRVVGKLTRHDIRNKLSIINSITYLLKKKIGSDPEVAEYLTDINLAVVMSDRLFEFSQLYEKIGVEEQTDIDIKNCFDEAVTLVPNLGAIKVVNKSKGLMVAADSLLRQIFYNLIDNSIKHGKKVTQIRLHHVNKDKLIKLYYEDNGVGVPTENKRKIFSEGFTTSQGTGLGLAIIRKIMEVYGWKITEIGIPGKGAKFEIIIPKESSNRTNSKT